MTDTITLYGEAATNAIYGETRWWGDDDSPEKAPFEAFVAEHEHLGDFLADPDEDFYQGREVMSVWRRKSDGARYGYAYWQMGGKHGEPDIESNGDEHGIEWDDERGGAYVFQRVTPFTITGYQHTPQGERMTDMTIRETQQRVAAINEANGWRETRPNVAPQSAYANWAIVQLALIDTEVAEGIEEVRNGRAVNETYYSDHKPDKPEGVPSELADVVIRALDCADLFDIDLAAIIDEKLRYNASRGYRHGNKRA